MLYWIGIGLIGFAGGLMSGIFGVGGGILFVPLLILLFNVNTHLAIGTSLAAIVLTALAGALRHYAAGWIDHRIALFLALFAMVGAWIGSDLSIRLDVVLLRKLFAAVLLFVALRLFFFKS
jgi:hypothetical protein